MKLKKMSILAVTSLISAAILPVVSTNNYQSHILNATELGTAPVLNEKNNLLEKFIRKSSFDRIA